MYINHLIKLTDSQCLLIILIIQVSGIVNIPEEVCDLNPQKVCRLATKLVPKLTPKHECTIIPKETCYLRFEQPRLERKPLKSEWCLDESGPMREEEYEEGEDFGLSVDLRNDAIVQIYQCRTRIKEDRF